ADSNPAIRELFNDVRVLLLVLSGVTLPAPAESVQIADRGLGYRQLGSQLVDQLQGIAVTPDFLFVAVAQVRPAEDDRADTLLVNHDSLDPVGRDRALNQGMLSQNLQHLGRLPREKRLLAPRFAKVGQVPRGCRRNCFDSRRKLPEGHHERPPPAGSLGLPFSPGRPSAPAGTV